MLSSERDKKGSLLVRHGEEKVTCEQVIFLMAKPSTPAPYFLSHALYLAKQLEKVLNRTSPVARQRGPFVT